MEVLFYPVLPDFQNNTASLKFPRHSPFGLCGKSNVWMKMSMEHWWNDSDRKKPKYSEKNPSECHFVNHMSHRLSLDRTRGSAARGRRLNARGMAWIFRDEN